MTGKIIKLINHIDDSGSLVCLENNAEIPFKAERLFFISGVTPGKNRGEHATFNAEFLYIAVRGCVRVILNTGQDKTEYILSDKTNALFVEKGVWITVDNFSHDAILLVISSETYQKCQYISDYEKFKYYKEKL